MKKQANATDSAEIRSAFFEKLFVEDKTMHIPATETELQNFFADQKSDGVLIYAAGPEHPVPCRHFFPKYLPGYAAEKFQVRCGAFFVFQIAVFAMKDTAVSLKTENPEWRIFSPPETVASGEMKVFYLGRLFGTDPGTEKEAFTIECSGIKNRQLSLTFERSGTPAADCGDHELERLSRLRWLDSNIGSEDTVYAPYIPLKVKGRAVSFLGHTLYLGENGLPENADSSFCCGNLRCGGAPEPMLKAPLYFGSGKSAFNGKMEFDLISQSRITWHCSGSIGNTPAELHGDIWFDGFVSIVIELETAQNIRLCLEPAFLEYFAGLGFHGGKTPEPFSWSFDPQRNQDSFWTGGINAGVRLRLRSKEHRTPLTNCYYHFDQLTPPEAWDNSGKGKLFFDREKFIFQTGDRDISKKLSFAFDLQFTPFYPFDPEKQFRSRTWHPLMHNMQIGMDDPVETADLAQLAKQGINRVTIHHAVGMNPFINYPYNSLSFDRLKDFVKKAHEHHIEVSLYYTMRELSIQIPEFYAMLWCGDIFMPGPMEQSRPATNRNGPHPWLCEHLDMPYLPAWAEVIKNGEAAGNTDIALETVPESRRLENFYLEGLRYLLEQCPIDGLYLDDTSLSREGFHRLHRIFRKYRGKAPFIDYHAWNPYYLADNPPDFGKASVIVRDMHIFPHITELWLGESFDYENSTYEYYLTEISGIPLGIPSEMLQHGGNQWRGILFGMTSRYGWFGDPRNIWRFFDSFGIDGLTFDISAPAPFELPDALHSTLFMNSQGKKAYAIASWSTKEITLDLHGMTVPEIPDFQKAASGSCIISPNRGVILLA